MGGNARVESETQLGPDTGVGIQSDGVDRDKVNVEESGLTRAARASGPGGVRGGGSAVGGSGLGGVVLLVLRALGAAVDHIEVLALDDKVSILVLDSANVCLSGAVRGYVAHVHGHADVFWLRNNLNRHDLERLIVEGDVGVDTLAAAGSKLHGLTVRSLHGGRGAVVHAATAL